LTPRARGTHWLARLTGLFLVASLTLVASAAVANERFALVVGANIGDADDTPLAFAERDASRMADVLTRFGGVPPENLLLLLGPDGASLGRAIDAFAGRIADTTPTRDPGGNVIFIYFSGHADAQALHLKGTRFAFRDLKARVARLAAEVSVFIVDACRSGGLVRIKGATPAEPFEIKADDQLLSEGLVIITSSSENEDAQESERLGGGVFTHHLITGLVGAADTSGDQRVTLSEAYRYAYTQTLNATSVTAVVQHPTFSFDLQGERELVLTRMENSAGFGRLRLAAAGHYIVFERFGGHDVAADLDAVADTELVLSPGSYLVRRRESSAVRELEVQVRPDDRTTVVLADLVRIPFRHVVRKGYGQAERSAFSLGADLDVTGAVLPDTGAFVLVAVAAQLDLADLAIRLRLRYGQDVGDNSSAPLGLVVSQSLFGLDLGLFKLFDLGPHGLGFGLRGGIDWLAQRFETRGDAPDRDQLVGRIGSLVRAEFALAPTVALTLDAGAEAWLMEVARPDGSALEARVVPIVSLGFGVLLP